MNRYRILIVDDDRLLQNALKNVLQEKYDPRVAGSGEEALEIVATEAIDLVLLDIRLPGMDGIAVLKELRERRPDLLIIMITAFEDIKTVITSMKMGAYDYLVKPLEIEMFELIIEKALETLRLKKEVEELRRVHLKKFNLDNVIGESEAIGKVLDFAEKVAKGYDTSVLIEGESGVGKEVIARIIHHRSNRFNKPFIGINCGAINRDLLESELFGYEKGAFTGGLQEGKKGKIEMADTGTLLLDEVGELRMSAQVKLLRFLEEREFYPVGGTRRKKVDVRIIAATNRRLEELVEGGLFRQDLFYRLNVARVVVPPLMERKADIIPLTLFFMNKFNEKFSKQFRGISPNARKLLVHHPWRGNIRELKNVVERVVLMEEGDTIEAEHLTFLTGAPQSEPPSEVKIPPDGLNLEKLNLSLIIQALELTGGNRTKASLLLGISRPTLIYRINKHGIKL